MLMGVNMCQLFKFRNRDRVYFICDCKLCIVKSELGVWQYLEFYYCYYLVLIYIYGGELNFY